MKVLSNVNTIKGLQVALSHYMRENCTDVWEDCGEDELYSPPEVAEIIFKNTTFSTSVNRLNKIKRRLDKYTDLFEELGCVIVPMSTDQLNICEYINSNHRTYYAVNEYGVYLLYFSIVYGLSLRKLQKQLLGV